MAVQTRPRKIHKVPKRKQRIYKRSKVPKRDPQQSLFSIVKFSTRKKLQVQMGFVKTKNGQKVGIPVFKADNNDFTPGFRLQDEFCGAYVKEQMSLHQKRMIIQTTEVDIENAQIPRPSVRNTYCSVCKKKYLNYFEHIVEEQHILRKKNSCWNILIGRMCQQYRLERCSNQKYDSGILQIAKENDETFKQKVQVLNKRIDMTDILSQKEVKEGMNEIGKLTLSPNSSPTNQIFHEVPLS